MKLDERKISNIHTRDIEKSIERYTYYFLGDGIIAKYMGLHDLYIHYSDIDNKYKLCLSAWIDHKFDIEGMGNLMLKSINNMIFNNWNINKNKVIVIDKINKLDKDRYIKVSINLSKNELLKIFALTKVS